MLRYNKGCIAMGIDVIKDWFDGYIVIQYIQKLKIAMMN